MSNRKEIPKQDSTRLKCNDTMLSERCRIQEDISYVICPPQELCYTIKFRDTKNSMMIGRAKREGDTLK